MLGKAAQADGTAAGLPLELHGDEAAMDRVLEVLYDSNRSAGLGSSAPNVNRWLGDILTYFPQSVVQVMQKDALERLHLRARLASYSPQEPAALPAGAPAFACTPDVFPDLMATAIRKQDVARWAARHDIVVRGMTK